MESVRKQMTEKMESLAKYQRESLRRAAQMSIDDKWQPIVECLSAGDYNFDPWDTCHMCQWKDSEWGQVACDKICPLGYNKECSAFNAFMDDKDIKHARKIVRDLKLIITIVDKIESES